jgi:mTERF domain-containing protein
LPKFQFFLSKGVSSSDIVSLLIANPKILHSSLEKRLIPLFELLSRFFKTNMDVIVCLIINLHSFAHNPYDRIVANINLMTDFGVCDSSIARLLQTWPSIFGSNDLIKSLEEVKGLGFDPSMTTFEDALMAKKYMTKKHWNKKVDVFKKQGWSDEVKGLGFNPSTTTFQYALSRKLKKEKVDNFKKWGLSDKDIDNAFSVRPDLGWVSLDKINLVMNFWINQLGWDSLALIKCPIIFCLSLEKRIIPRASVLQFLLMKGLREKDSSLVTPIYKHEEKFFLKRFVFRFKGESDYLLKLYEDKMKLAYTKEKNNGTPFTK